MSDATLTSKGQTTIPKDIRDSLGLQAGHRMPFTRMPDGSVLLHVRRAAPVARMPCCRYIRCQGRAVARFDVRLMYMQSAIALQ